MYVCVRTDFRHHYLLNILFFCYRKATTIDPRYEPAWIGFGHSFAIEGEHDQAITAYNTAAKLFKG